MTYILDRFTGNNDDSINGRTAETGQTWTTRLSSMKITSNKAVAGTNGERAIATIPTSWANVSVEASLLPNAVFPCYAGLVLRWTDNNNYWLVRLVNYGGNNLRLYEINGGTETLRAFANPTFDIDAPVRVRAVCNGSTISVTAVQGGSSLSIEYTGASHNASATTHGIMSERETWNYAVSTVDDFLVWSGAGAPPPNPLNPIALTSPAAFQVHQRTGKVADIAIEGEIGSLTARDIQASFNGGAFVTIATGVTSTFSGVLTGQRQGQGSLVVRFADDHATSVTVENVGVGDVFVLAGQSNISGRGTAAQSWSHSTLVACQFGNNYAWGSLAAVNDSNVGQVDAVSSDADAGQNYIPRVATAFMADQGVPIAFVPCALGGTAIVSWLPGVNHQDRTTLYGSMVYRTLQAGGAKAVIFHQGESDATISGFTGGATYKSRLLTFANAVWDDLGIPVVVSRIHKWDSAPSTTQPNVDEINGAMAAAASENSHILLGPDFDKPTRVTGALHFTTDGDMIEAAARMWAALKVLFYTPTGNVQVLINDVDLTDRLIASSLRWTEYEGGQTGAMSLEIEDPNDDLNLSEWQEIAVIIDPDAAWGGYIVRALPGLTAGGNRRWSLQCESWDTLLNRTPIVRRTYVNQTPAQIIADIFQRAGLDEFDTTTHVYGSFPVVPSFVAGGDKLTDLLDRLALLVGASWSININKEIVFQPAASLPTAPFAIKALGLADFSTSYPPSGTPTPDIDATDIRNRVTVYGGVVPSAIQVDFFTGDGANKRFTLGHAPVHEIVKVTVDGVLQWHGYDYYDSQFNDYDCLVDYTLGTVRWLDAPDDGAEIEVQYRYKQQLVTVRQSDASHAQYGRWFDFELRDSSLTTEPACIAAADALLAEYAFPSVGASLEVEWFGPRAGQRIQVEMPTLGLSGYYVVRQATIELARSTRTALVSLKVGGRPARLSRVIGGERGTGSLLGPGAYMPVQPAGTLSGEIDLLRVRDRIEVIDRSTTFISPSNYGNATGLVLLFDAVQQRGQLLGLNNGALQACFAHDGTIKWDGGNGILNDKGLFIGNTSFGAAGIQLEHNDASPRAYIGNGTDRFIKYEAGDIQLSGTVHATAGDFLGSVYVGASTPRILIDGANKRIESTTFASGTTGFRIEGTDGSAEFNNVTVRGSLVATVLQYGHVQATSGSVWVTKAAGRSLASFVAASIGSASNLDIKDPQGVSHSTAGALWSVGDVVRLKEPLAGDFWGVVASKTDMTTYWRLSVTASSGSGTFTAGAAVLNYGQSGDGVVRITADASNNPYISIATHAGSPWSAMTERARLGNLTGISGASGYGLWTDNGHFTGTVNASSGVIGGWTIAATKLYSEDVGASAGVGMASYGDAGVWAFWSGSNTPANAEFRVDKYGNLYATSATITGAITASSGSITGTLTMGASGKIVGGSAWELNQGGLTIADTVDTALLFGGGTSYMKLWTSGAFGGAIDTASFPLGLNGKTITVNSNPANNGGVLQLRNNSATLIELQAAKLGFFGVTPVTRPAAYTFTNGATDRVINCTSTTLGEVANVLYTLWSDLKNLGLLQ